MRAQSKVAVLGVTAVAVVMPLVGDAAPRGGGRIRLGRGLDAVHRLDRSGPSCSWWEHCSRRGHSAGLAAANLATAAFQDVELAEAAGYVSTIDALGCFENAEAGGMGAHYLNEALMDATSDIAAPEALVYELGASGEVAGLVAHEYIVPVEAWTAAELPNLFGVDFHQHPVLPLWVLPAGSVVHGAAEEAIATRTIAEVIGRHLDIPVVSVASADTAEHFGWFGSFFCLDIPASSAVTQERLGWTPTHPTLLDDLEGGSYFR